MPNIKKKIKVAKNLIWSLYCAFENDKFTKILMQQFSLLKKKKLHSSCCTMRYNNNFITNEAELLRIKIFVSENARFFSTLIQSLISINILEKDREKQKFLLFYFFLFLHGKVFCVER